MGKAEKSNKRVNTLIRACLEEYRDFEDNWDLYCAPLILTMNATMNERKGFSRHMLALNREVNMPTSLMVDSEELTIKEGTSPRIAEKVRDMHKFMKAINLKVQENENRNIIYAQNRHEVL